MLLDTKQSVTDQELSAVPVLNHNPALWGWLPMPGVDVCDGSLDPFEKMSFAFASLQVYKTLVVHTSKELWWKSQLCSQQCYFSWLPRLKRGSPVLKLPFILQVLASSILLMNLLIAQLNSSYVYIYQDSVEHPCVQRWRGFGMKWRSDRIFNQPVVLGQDMVGFARLNRAQKIVEAAPCFCTTILSIQKGIPSKSIAVRPCPISIGGTLRCSAEIALLLGGFAKMMQNLS